MHSVHSGPYEAVAGLSRWMAESALRLDGICGRAQDDLARQQVSALTACFEGAIIQLQAIAEARSPRELISLQADASAKIADKFLASLHEAVDIHGQVREELRDWLNDVLALAQHGPVERPGLRKAA